MEGQKEVVSWKDRSKSHVKKVVKMKVDQFKLGQSSANYLQVFKKYLHVARKYNNDQVVLTSV